MTRPLISLVLAACLSACTSAPPPAARNAAGWAEFHAAFQKAVDARDTAALRPLMSDRFDYTFGDGAPTPENAFTFWGRPEINGWQALKQVAAQPAVDFTPPPQWGLKGKVKLAPPEAAHDGYRQWRAAFEQQPDGTWRFVSFLSGD